MNFYFCTLGCKVNQYETNAMQALVQNKGHFVVSEEHCPDVIVINSCTVTAESDRKTRQTVRRLRKNNPSAIIVLTGCMPQAFPKTSAALKEADVVMGNANLESLCELVEQFKTSGEKVIHINQHSNKEKYTTPVIDKFNERTRAYLKIEDGCERYCTYCIIPKARGYVRSKTPEQITKEVEALAKNGHKEIVLVGINLSAYGQDIGCDLHDAVEAAAKVKEVERIRLGSLEPDLFSDQLLFNLSKQKKLCEQFHFSLQSGCDATLKRMNRHYDGKFYADLIEIIRSNFNNPSITTDIMVGFAGETDDEFNQSVQFVKQIGFARAHIFSYSQREGTIAANLPNQVDKSVKEHRNKIMTKAAFEGEQKFLKTQIGREEYVLFEQQKGDFCYGYTRNYTLVKVKADNLHGKLIKVKITDLFEDGCIGII